MPNGIYSGFRFQSDLLQQDIPESLVAVVGYPHRETSSNKKYSEIYLMCQPVDPKKTAKFHELNRAEVLELLRLHKKENRFVPDWIDETHDEAKIQRLSAILQEWMKAKVPQQATSIILDIAKSHKGMLKTPPKSTQKLEDKFKIENFDLIVWEYVSR